MTKILGYVASKSTGKSHVISEGKDGVIYCDCWAWKKNKTCKHLYWYYKNIHKTPIPVKITPLRATIEQVIKEITNG